MVGPLGSILFMISGVASFVDPGGKLLAPLPAHADTAAGALCFRVGVYLLIPEQAETRPQSRAER